MLLTMTDNELLRIKVIQDICDKRLTGVEAAHLLNLSPRQVYRLVKRFIEFGASGLVSLQRGQPGNHRYDENIKLQTLAILHEHYTDFGPTLAHEKLIERHDIHVSVETIRQWMSAFDYMVATREYLEQHGKPTAFYSDRHAVFHVSKRDAKTERLTQFGRVLHDLNIELICANSSQAKGRVERTNKTLQDRLVKEMRLQGIDTIEQANVWLSDFIADFNRRFAKPAKYPKDMHRPVREMTDELNDIFAWQELRKLSKSLTFQYENVVYLIDPKEENQRLINQVVKVLDRPDGTIAIQYCQRKLTFKVFNKLADIDQGQIVDNKRLGAVLKFAQEKHQEFEQQQNTQS